MMDPEQRILLELGYTTMHGASHRRSTLMETDGGVFMGAERSDWSHARPQSLDSVSSLAGLPHTSTLNPQRTITTIPCAGVCIDRRRWCGGSRSSLICAGPSRSMLGRRHRVRISRDSCSRRCACRSRCRGFVCCGPNYRIEARSARHTARGVGGHAFHLWPKQDLRRACEWVCTWRRERGGSAPTHWRR
jgi:hypothetical protein